jgi:hypothetical protein
MKTNTKPTNIGIALHQGLNNTIALYTRLKQDSLVP